jgi:putative ABC transport system permease protein
MFLSTVKGRAALHFGVMRETSVAWRRLRQQRSFAATAIITLSLGIAAPTALFAIVNATLLQPLPYRAYHDIYTVRTTMTDGRFTIGLVANEEMSALRAATDTVMQSALMRRRDDTILTDAGARQVTSFGVSEEFFDLFGLPMAAGRAFTVDDFAGPPASRVVLSNRAWKSIYGSNPDVVGATIRFAGGSSLVVGVAPASFAIPREADLWFAQRAPESIGHYFDAFVRFRPGATPQSLGASLGSMWEELGRKYPDQAKNRVFVMRPLLDTMIGGLKPIVLIAFAATGLLLILALVNVANLLLARGATRAREAAVRTALGASRWDTLRPLLAESLLLTSIATALALPLAALAVKSIVLLGGDALPRVEGMQLDTRVFLFTTTAMIVAATLVALAPAASAARINLAEVMNEGGRGGIHGRATRRALAAMIVLEVTVAIALVAGGGRLLLSMRHLLAIDPGFTAQGRLAIDVLMPPDYANPAQFAAWSTEAERRLRNLGATGIATASSLPLRHEWDTTTFVDITNRPTTPATRPNGRLRIVSPSFFDVMQIRIVAGRPFTIDDRRDGEPVVLVNRAWARKFIPDLDPLRERVNPGTFGRRVDGRFVPRDAAIVGVVDDVPYEDVTKPAEPMVYVADAQVLIPRRSIVVTTADGHPERLIPQIRAELAALDSRVPIEFAQLSELISRSLLWSRLGVLLVTTFALAGLVLAASGVFGVIAFVSAQRSPEMAVRLALGATPGQIIALVLRHAGRLALVGVGLGLMLAGWTGYLMRTYLYGANAGSWLVIGGSSIIVFAVCMAATVPAARRAAVTHPAQLLRS